MRDVGRGREHVRAKGRRRAAEKRRGSRAPTATITRSLHRGEETAGGAIEREARVLPGRALAETCQPLHVPPDRAGIRLVLFRQHEGVGGELPRQLQSLDRRLDHLLTGRAELLGRGPPGGSPGRP